MRLLIRTSPKWAETVLQDFDKFLLDHAACERKASALAMSLVSHYPDRQELVREMIDLALEEMEHFKQVNELIEKRNLMLGGDEKDAYVNRLRKLVRGTSDEYLLDRLLIAGIIEARGCERFEIIARALTEPELANFYMDITRSEARHHGLFLRLARNYFDATVVDERLAVLLEAEAKIVESLPFRAAVH